MDVLDVVDVELLVVEVVVEEDALDVEVELLLVVVVVVLVVVAEDVVVLAILHQTSTIPYHPLPSPSPASPSCGRGCAHAGATCGPPQRATTEYCSSANLRTPVCFQVEIRTIDDQHHPCFGERGLFARKDFAAGGLIGWYTGIVRPRGHSTYSSSKYVASVSTIKGDYDIDARHKGNEMRFLNDYRNISDISTANAKFESFEHFVGKFAGQLDLRGDFAVPVHALRPITTGEEIMLDYGG